jgi:hypothetical protein
MLPGQLGYVITLVLKKKIHKKQIMEVELKITSTKATCWHRHDSCIYLTCIFYQRTVITQIFSAC